MSATTAALVCPECKGPMFDNRGDKRSPTAPDARCRDRDCTGRIGKVKPAPAPSNGVTVADAPSVLAPTRDLPQPPGQAPAGQGSSEPEKLTACYLTCLDFTLGPIRQRYEAARVPLDAATIAATTATLFIARWQGRR